MVRGEQAAGSPVPEHRQKDVSDPFDDVRYRLHAVERLMRAQLTMSTLAIIAGAFALFVALLGTGNPYALVFIVIIVGILLGPHYILRRVHRFQAAGERGDWRTVQKGATPGFVFLAYCIGGLMVGNQISGVRKDLREISKVYPLDLATRPTPASTTREDPGEDGPTTSAFGEKS
jgi:hypothetical protein